MRFSFDLQESTPWMHTAKQPALSMLSYMEELQMRVSYPARHHCPYNTSTSFQSSHHCRRR
jgi:hypothetical protein